MPDVTTGDFPGTCYVPKNRYLTVAPNPANNTATARRLSVQLAKRECGAGANQGAPCTKDADCVGVCEDMPIGCASDADCAAVALGSVCASTGTCVQVLGWFGVPDVMGYVRFVDAAARHNEIWTNGQYPIDCGVDALCPANAFCDTGIGGSLTCKLNAGATEVLWDFVNLGDCQISTMIRDTRPGVAENRAARYYLVEAILQGSDITDPSNYSTALVLPTVRVWTDNAGSVANSILTPPDGQKGFLDILNQVNRFKGKGLAHMSWFDYEPAVPDHGTGFLDMLQGVGGFKDVPYPFDDPCTCTDPTHATMDACP